MIRATTNGVLKGYRSNLMTSFIKLNSARNTLLSQRNFNTYAEDPAAASQCFQIRRSFQRVSTQMTLSDATMHKYETAYSALEKVVGMVDNEADDSALAAALRAANKPTGAGRTALGKEMMELSDSIVQSMNSKYGDVFTFAGADGHNVPFTWETGADGARQLCYRGVPVDVSVPEPIYADPDDPTSAVTNQDEIDKAKEQLAKLDYMSGESRFVDIGIGLQEHNGELIKASAFNDALQGINFLGYGVDKNGDSDNIASIINRMGQLLANCKEDSGEWASDEDMAEYQRLAEKFDDVAAELKKGHVELSTRALFLKNNHDQLKTTANTLNTQFLDIEQCDLADAITSFSWAQYCYNAALKVGNSILSQSLMDYLG